MTDEARAYRADELERSIIEFWNTNDTFRRSISNRRGKDPFVWLEGPPTANGLPHAGHVLTRTMKDVVCRYKTMRGYYVERKAGWDCHGLPVEIEVEKELGLKNKQDIETYGVAAFNQKCRESVFRYKKEWEDTCARLGQWVDFENPYVTLTNDYIESVWWSLQQAWEKKLLFKGFRVAPSCARCGTALSSHEVALGYKDVEEPSVFVKFKVVGKPNEYLLAWTTTPWTLPGNCALAVGADIDYVTVEQQAEKGAERYTLAKGCLGVIRGEHKVIAEMKGENLRGTKYEPLFPFLKSQPEFGAPNAKVWFVDTADFVNTDDGTGIVHTAVMYGEDDYEFGVKHGIPQKHTVQLDGRFA
ncbi:MAG TPA: class I tRNA ligase family protein, partial [Candidatus Thermoplasmatota archaeon]